jgi:hypothetical protein
MLKRMAIAIALCAMSAPIMSAQTKTIDDGACHVTVPANWSRRPYSTWRRQRPRHHPPPQI